MIMLSLVIPCYNEAQSLPSLIHRCHEVFADTDIECVIVDNGSTDETPHLLKGLLAHKKNIRSLRVPQNRGYGDGILYGLKSCQTPFLAWTHADLQTDPHDVLRAYQTIQKQANPMHCMVKGRRYGRSLWDQFFTFGMSIFSSVMLKCWMFDINAQPNLISRSFFESWVHPPHDFSLDLYAYYQARKQALKVVRLDVFFGDRQHGVSHWNFSLLSKYKFIKRTVDFTFKLKHENLLK